MFLFLVDGVLFGVAVHKNQDQLINIYIYINTCNGMDISKTICVFSFLSAGRVITVGGFMSKGATLTVMQQLWPLW